MAIDVPAPRPASTVVLVRPGAGAPEIFMVKRHARSSFGTAYAFPGGVVEPADREVHEYCAGLSAAEANRLLDVDSGGLDYYGAAVRELFEEAGVLLGRTPLPAADLDRMRAALNADMLRWDDFARDAELLISCDRLHYFSFWITPVGLPKRYSTRFFLAELPAGQSASHCGGELTDSCWMPAARILQAHREETKRVLPPTRKTLESIAEFSSTESLCEWARRCGEHGVLCNRRALSPELFA